jgi:NTP pyrophosphatase (non-canonical NTP hydrolase)
MKIKNWRNAPAEILALKLCEEAGEVAKEITEAYQEGRQVHSEKTQSELTHVIRIASQLKINLENR